MLQPKTYIQYNYSRIRNVLIFLFFFGFLKSVWGRTGHQNRWKWHFYCFVLLFLMIHGSSRRILQFIAASFGVWGYRNRFLRSIMNVIQDSWITQVKKKIWNHLWNSLWEYCKSWSHTKAFSLSLSQISTWYWYIIQITYTWHTFMCTHDIHVYL